MKQREITVNVEKGIKELVIREGEAAPNILFKKVEQTTDISGPFAFFEKQKSIIPSLNNAILVVDYEQGSLKLIWNFDNSLESYISGHLKLSDELNRLSINSGKPFTTREFSELCRKNRHLFTDPSRATELAGIFAAFKAKIENEIAAENNNRGTTNEQRIIRLVEGSLPKDFEISIPILKNVSKQQFTVSIFFEVKDSNVYVVLDCVEIAIAIEKQKVLLIDDQLSDFDGALAVIYK